MRHLVAGDCGNLGELTFHSATRPWGGVGGGQIVKLNGVKRYEHAGWSLEWCVLHFPHHHTACMEPHKGSSSSSWVVSVSVSASRLSQQLPGFKVVQPGARHHTQSPAVCLMASWGVCVWGGSLFLISSHCCLNLRWYLHSGTSTSEIWF